MQSDWNATTGDAFIANKPTIPSGNQIIDWTVTGAGTIHANNYTNTTYSVGDGGLTQKNFTTALKDKLDGLSSTTLTNATLLSSAGTYMVNASSDIDITLPDSAIGSIITLYGIGSSAYSIKGTTINGTTLSGTQYVLAGANTATVCIATGTSAWVVYVSGVYSTISGIA